MLLALALLCLGAAVYVGARNPDQVRLLPAGWHWPALGRLLPTAVAGSLPSFVHVYAFGLLTALCLRPGRAAFIAASTGWCAIDLAFEFAQHPALTDAIRHHAPSRIRDELLSLAGLWRGTFDPADVVAAVLGGIASAVTSMRGSSGRRPAP